MAYFIFGVVYQLTGNVGYLYWPWRFSFKQYIFHCQSQWLLKDQECKCLKRKYARKSPFICMFSTNANMDLTWFDHLFFLFCSGCLPCHGRHVWEIGCRRRWKLHPTASQKHIYYSNGLDAGHLALYGAYLVECDLPAILGSWDRTSSFHLLPCGLWRALPSSMRVIRCTMCGNPKETDKWKDLSHHAYELARLPPFYFLALAAGSCEEIIFRGFMINYVAEMISFSYAEAVALIVPAFIFSISHIYRAGLPVVKNCFYFSLVWCFVYVHYLLIPGYDHPRAGWPYFQGCSRYLVEVQIKTKCQNLFVFLFIIPS